MTASDWQGRELCPDGGCTGLIGPEGTCKVCGTAAPDRPASAEDPDDEGDEDEDAEDYENDEEDEEEDDEEEDDDDGGDERAAAPGATSEWSDRQLCPDGACLGVIGSDGACKVCGTRVPGWNPSNAPAPAAQQDDADELAAAAAELADSVPPEAAAQLAPAPSEDEDAPRALCPDGACVGTIGKDGTCKLCGKSAA